MDNIITTENITFRYDDDGEDALAGLTLAVRKGEFLAVVGANGSGKSTLAKHFNAILLPSGGRVLVRGMDTADEALTTAIRQIVGMVFQNPDNQLVASIVEEDVAFGPENLGVKHPELRRRVDDALRAVDMYDYRLRAPHMLSGGQKQRVAIAGIIAMQPECVVLDEPTSMLDPQGRREVIAAVRRLSENFGITIVLITHYMEEAAQADRVVVMDGGKILTEGTPGEVFSRVDLLKSHRLDVPQAAELAAFLRGQGFPVPDGILTPEQCADAIIDIMHQ